MRKATAVQSAVRVVCYSRFSTDKQDPTSIADQERISSQYAERQGWKIGERYSDAGISGAAMGNRPGFQRMRADAMAGKFNVLLIADCTRLARSQELAPLIDRFRFQGVRVIGVQDAFDSAAGTADMQAGLSGIMSVEFRRMIKHRTHAALESRARVGRSAGGKAYAYTNTWQVVPAEAAVVIEIFEKFTDGRSSHSIAAALNARGVPSPGSSWTRTQRRAQGWVASGVRVILRNERYRGVVHWNTSEWKKDPDTGKRKRIERPRSEWISRADESLRIISDALWERARLRFKRINESGKWAQPKGKPKYLLSGLLRCAVCGSHFVIANRHEYQCSSYKGGAACTNSIRVRRDALEDYILGRVRSETLSPENVECLAKELHGQILERLKAMRERAAEAPKEIQDITARIGRLRERLKHGDPDMTPDEIQAAIDRAEAKRQELETQQPEARQSAKVLTVLPAAAKLYRRQIAEGLDGNERAALKARVFLRELLGRINLIPEGKELWAEYGIAPAALLKVVGFVGSGGRI